MAVAMIWASGPIVADQGVDGRRVLQAQACAQRKLVLAPATHVDHVRCGIDVLRIDVARLAG